MYPYSTFNATKGFFFDVPVLLKCCKTEII